MNLRPEPREPSLIPDIERPNTWLRPLLSVIVAPCVALLTYALIYDLGRPRNPHPDPALALRLLPLELLIGLAAGLRCSRTFGLRQRTAPRPDVQERMVTRFALRRGRAFDLQELVDASPLTRAQASGILAQCPETGRLEQYGEHFRLRVERPVNPEP